MIGYEGWKRGGIRHEALVLIQFDIHWQFSSLKWGEKKEFEGWVQDGNLNVDMLSLGCPWAIILERFSKKLIESLA